MFGRIRSWSSLESLERPPSKIIKDDCLSIYEATMMKLKQGSNHDSSPSFNDCSEGSETNSGSSSLCAESMNIETCDDPLSSARVSQEIANSIEDNLMTVDTDSLNTYSPKPSGDCQPTKYAAQHRIKSFTILYLFSKYKDSSGNSNLTEAVSTEDICCVDISPSSCASQSTDDIETLSD